MSRLLPLALLVALLPAAAPAYIAVPADRLTLCEVMLEFPTVLRLELDRADDATGAARFTVKDVPLGKYADPALKLARLDGGAVPARLRGLPAAAPAVAFLGSPDNRSLVFGTGGWFITRPDQGWERFTQFRDDFDALFVGTPVELAAAARTLARGGDVTVPVRPAGVQKGERLFVRYDAAFPHRRWPALPPAGDAPPAGSVAARQHAALRLAGRVDAAPALLKALTDPHPDVRAAAVVSLGSTPPTPETVRALAARLKDTDRFVCAFAAWALAKAGPVAATAVPDLVAALDDRNFDHDFRPHRAAEAAEAILALAPNTPAAERAVRFFLTDKMLRDHRVDSEGTRTAAARALGRAGPWAKAALPELTRALGDPLPATRVAAAEAVLLVGGRPDAAAVKVLAAAVATGDPGTRVQAIRAVLTTRTVELLPAIDAAVADAAADPAVRAAGRITAAELRRK